MPVLPFQAASVAITIMVAFLSVHADEKPTAAASGKGHSQHDQTRSGEVAGPRQEADVTESTPVDAVIMPNTQEEKGTKWTQYLVSVDEV